MKRPLARWANSLLRPFGAQLTRVPSVPFDLAPLQRLRASGCQWASLIDLGAARGAWSAAYLREGLAGPVLAVEPLAEHEVALRTLQATHPQLRYCLAAAGATDGATADLHVTADLDGSTVAGGTGEPRQVPLRTVDALVAEFQLPPPYFLKFDTHGYEIPILRGARQTLAHTAALVMEMYNFPISPSALLFPEMCAHLESLGFRCCDLSDPLRRPGDQVLWQVDLWFRRASDAIFQRNQYQ